jgi:hypothetical protein
MQKRSSELIDLYYLLDSQIHTGHFQKLLVVGSPSWNPNPPSSEQVAVVMVPPEARVALGASWW